MKDLSGKRIAILLDNSGVEQVELTTPWRALADAGAQTKLLAPEKGTVQAFNNDVEKGDTFDADLAVGDASGADYDGLVLPGGTTNADSLRMDSGAVGFVYRNELKQAAADGEDVDAVRLKLQAEYEDTLVNPYVAAERGYVDAVIPPSHTRLQVSQALRLLDRKVVDVPAKKHGNVPL